jgi:hypothetical protein
MNKMLVSVVIVIALSGCASGVEKMRNLDPGMNTSEVDKIMGRRDGFKFAEHEGSLYTLYEYTNQYCNARASMSEKCDFYVIFKDEQVVETGVRNVRSEMPNMQFLYLFQN